jgi:hypothetical protein
VLVLLRTLDNKPELDVLNASPCFRFPPFIVMLATDMFEGIFDAGQKKHAQPLSHFVVASLKASRALFLT